MLHLGSSHYRASRSRDLLQLKRYLDAETVVVAHLLGRVKCRGMLGALLVESAGGLRFRPGTGFSDAEREAPPAVGSTITYKDLGTTRHGLPRFASFMRMRAE
ncbi:MAG: DNA ligase-1 [Bermanella sp.]|jgi:DNA ligase-1